MKSIDIKFNIGEIVFLKTDVEQFEHIVTAVVIKGHGASYELSTGNSASYHIDVEISKTKDVLKKLMYHNN